MKLSPEVAKVEVLLSPFRPTHRIIHIADRHYLSREQYRSVQIPPSEEGYSEYCREVENIQSAHFRLLLWLSDLHGLRQVFDEGIDQEHLPNYRESIERGRGKHSWPELMSCLAELRRQIDEAEANGQDATSLRSQKAQLEKRRLATRRAGAVAQLLLARPSVEVLATEDKQAYECADRAMKVARETRNIKPFVAANGPREEAIVRNLLQHRCSVIVLGGGHDLSRQITRLSDARCEYVKVMVNGYPESKRPSRLYPSKTGVLAHTAASGKWLLTHFIADPENDVVLAAIIIFGVIIVARTRSSPAEIDACVRPDNPLD